MTRVVAIALEVRTVHLSQELLRSIAQLRFMLLFALKSWFRRQVLTNTVTLLAL